MRSFCIVKHQFLIAQHQTKVALQGAQPKMTKPGLCETQYQTAWAAHPLRVFTVTGTRPGPVLALIGGVHGDELEGPLTLARLMQDLSLEKLAGTLIICPAANPEALSASQRCSPSDGGNLARCFPGDPDGSPTEVLANLIARHVIRPADALVDLHSGGGPLDCPVFAGYGDNPETRAATVGMANAFGAPVIWRHPAPMAPGRTLSEADSAGIPAIYIEAGGGIAPPLDVLALYGAGVRRVMAHLGMMETEQHARPTQLRVFGNGNLDAAVMAPATGLCTCKISLLDQIDVGDICFEITDINGQHLSKVTAQSAGVAIFLRRSRWVTAGDLLMASATPEI